MLCQSWDTAPSLQDTVVANQGRHGTVVCASLPCRGWTTCNPGVPLLSALYFNVCKCKLLNLDGSFWHQFEAHWFAVLGRWLGMLRMVVIVNFNMQVSCFASNLIQQQLGVASQQSFDAKQE